jgi:hypothetical protein
MSKKVIAFTVVSSIVAAVAVAEPATAGESPEWSLQNCVDAAGKPTDKIASDVKCELKNHKNNLCLIRDSHMGQADMDFAPCDKHPKSVLFHKESGGAINYGDPVALKLGVSGGKEEWYRKCVNPQTLGINICSDSGSPEKKHFEWQLRGGSGQVEVNKPFALFNVSRGDSMVWAENPSKMINFCWDKDRVGKYCKNPRPK